MDPDYRIFATKGDVLVTLLFLMFFTCAQFYLSFKIGCNVAELRTQVRQLTELSLNE